MKPLPDIVDYNLKILFIGYNPGIKSAETGHHYAGGSNAFWKLLFESGLTSWRFKPEEDRRLLELGLGSTNIADRPTRSAAELQPNEFREGAAALRELLMEYQPKIACYVGIGVYRKFSGLKEVGRGRQENATVPGVIDFVCSSSSGLNRIPYAEQLECFKNLKSLIP